MKWEFPGGKIEKGESPEDALIREIEEELGISIQIMYFLDSNIHQYATKAIRLIPFVCKIKEGEISLREHAQYKWLNRNELLDLDWAEADIPIVNAYLKQYDE